MLETLHKIVQEVSAASNLEVALRTTVSQVRESMQVDVCSVYLADDDDGSLLLMATEGLLQESVGQVRLASGEGLIGLVAAKVKPVNLDDAPSHPGFRYFPETGEEPYHAFLGVPAIHQRKLVGVLAVQQREARRFSETHVAFMVTLASQLAAIIAYDRVDSDHSISMKAKKERQRSLQGLPGAPGVAIGQAVVIYPAAELKMVPDRTPVDIAAEEQRFHESIKQVRNDMQAASTRLKGILPQDELGLFDAYAMMADDVELVDEIIQSIRSGNWAPGALRENIEKRARFFEQLDESYLRERASDVRDLGQCILNYLQEQAETVTEYPAQTVLVGEQITAMDIAEVPAGRLVGIVSSRGSTLSHVAILAHSLNIPAVMGLEDLPLAHLDGHTLVVDGYRGLVHDNPAPAMKKEFERLASEEQQLTKQLEKFRDTRAETPDGWRVSIDATIGLLDGIAPALLAGSDGVGLYRTELPFMVRERFPTEEEQYAIYRHLLESFAPSQVTLRTLDVGGDKPLSYFPITESNPFLGWRGIRMSLDHPEILLTQLRAALRASIGLGNLKLLFPMVTTISEVDEALTLFRQVESELSDEGIESGKTPVGVMIEVPAAAYEAARIARRVDFLSIGTNDLTQYMLAVDRTNQRVANLFDPLQPAVLGLVQRVVNDGHAVGKPVGICGEVASSPVSALPFLGMDIDWMSVSTADVPRLKWLVQSFTRTRLKQLLGEVMQLENSRDIRRFLENALEEVGLGGLARPGI